MGVGKELFGQFYDLSAGGSTDFRSGNAAFHEMLITDDTKKILSKYDQTGYASDHLPNYTGAYSGADVMPLIRIPEMYYIMAECDPDPQSSAEILVWFVLNGESPPVMRQMGEKDMTNRIPVKDLTVGIRAGSTK